MAKLDRFINHLIKIGEKSAERAKKISLPFFEGVPLYDVALFFWRSMDRGSITTRASAIAFSFFIAFFPPLIISAIFTPASKKRLSKIAQKSVFRLQCLCLYMLILWLIERLKSAFKSIWYIIK